MWTNATVKDPSIGLPKGTKVLISRVDHSYKSIGPTWWVYANHQLRQVAESYGGRGLKGAVLVGSPFSNQEKAAELVLPHIQRHDRQRLNPPDMPQKPTKNPQKPPKISRKVDKSAEKSKKPHKTSQNGVQLRYGDSKPRNRKIKPTNQRKTDMAKSKTLESKYGEVTLKQVTPTKMVATCRGQYKLRILQDKEGVWSGIPVVEGRAAEESVTGKTAKIAYDKAIKAYWG